MATPKSRYDRYGRPLPTLAMAAPQDMSQSPANHAQREHILLHVRRALEEHYPHLLRRDVTAEVTLTFKVVDGTMQREVFVSIRGQYRTEDMPDAP
jgi:hypothetical protein